MKKILIIDDDTYILRSFSTVLTKRGFEVETAETGKQALEKLKHGSFNLALIDVCLPDMEGTDLLENAKKELEKTVKIMLNWVSIGKKQVKKQLLKALTPTLLNRLRWMN